MKNKKVVLFIIISCCMIFALSACGSKKEVSDIELKGKYEESNNSGQYGYATPETAAEFPADAKAEGISSTSSFQSNNVLLNSNDKIIRRANLEVETQDFDGLIKSIDTKINQLNGYIESSNISGRYYYSDNMRYGNIVARVPKDRLDEFINTVNDIANVVNNQSSTENITIQYVDVESHKKALEIEQERLLALLEKVETLEDIITLETRLSGVRYELEMYETQLRTYDNLVEYSSVTLNIQEVERMTAKVVEKKTVWNRIQTGFGDTMYNLGEGFKNFIVWFIVNLPYIIIWVVVITVIVLIIKKYFKKMSIENNRSIHTHIPNLDKKVDEDKK